MKQLPAITDLEQKESQLRVVWVNSAMLVAAGEIIDEPSDRAMASIAIWMTRNAL
jgi:hypothetical protein